MGTEVDVYIQKQVSPQKENCQSLEEIILKISPNIKEEMRLGVPWYEGKYYIVALKDHVNLGFSLKGLPKEDVSLFKKGRRKTMKIIEIRSLDEIDEHSVIRLLKIVK